jgi:hypothetical protein
MKSYEVFASNRGYVCNIFPRDLDQMSLPDVVQQIANETRLGALYVVECSNGKREVVYRMSQSRYDEWDDLEDVYDEV